jgi:hypothetical protein
MDQERPRLLESAIGKEKLRTGFTRPLQPDGGWKALIDNARGPEILDRD